MEWENTLDGIHSPPSHHFATSIWRGSLTSIRREETALVGSQQLLLSADTAEACAYIAACVFF